MTARWGRPGSFPYTGSNIRTGHDQTEPCVCCGTHGSDVAAFDFKDKRIGHPCGAFGRAVRRNQKKTDDGSVGNRIFGFRQETGVNFCGIRRLKPVRCCYFHGNHLICPVILRVILPVILRVILTDRSAGHSG